MRHDSGRTAFSVVGLLVALCMVVSAVPVGAEVVPGEAKIEKVLDSPNELSEVAQAPDRALWLLERTTGTIRVVVAGHDHATLTLPVGSACDSGLLGVAFAPDFISSHRAFVYYVDSAYNAKVVEVFHLGPGLQLGDTIIDLGSAGAGCRPGGGIDVGPDGMLYVAVGDMGTSGDAQDDGSVRGKVLRHDLSTGTTETYAKGFRDGQSLDVDPDGTVYMTDLGDTTNVDDEVNAVSEGGNYAWDADSGDTGGVYDDPITSYLPSVGAEGVAVLTGDAMGPGQDGSLVYACSDPAADDMRQAFLLGGTLSHEETFYNPLGDLDGEPDTGCPRQFTSVTEGMDGWLYAANKGNSPGVWRVYHDVAGPREVSAPGSPFHLTLDKISPTKLRVEWEDLGPVDAGRADGVGPNPRVYQIWQGSLASLAAGAYDHASLMFTDGTANGIIRRYNDITLPADSAYFLISAKNENIEGTLGTDSSGTTRPGGNYDYCGTIGYDPIVANPAGDPQLCAPKWVDYDTGGELYLRDYNPNSPTYLQDLTLSDWRGKVVRVDISAVDCYYCNEQAQYIHEVNLDFAERDFVPITVLTLFYSNRQAIPESLCQNYISNWANSHGEDTPILCDVDKGGLFGGDVSEQYWVVPGCNGTPQNFYVDQAGILYDFVCGGQLSAYSMSTDIRPKVNDPCVESCSGPDIPWDQDDTCE